MLIMCLDCIISLNLSGVGELAGAGGVWRWVFGAIFGHIEDIFRALQVAGPGRSG